MSNIKLRKSIGMHGYILTIKDEPIYISKEEFDRLYAVLFAEHYRKESKKH